METSSNPKSRWCLKLLRKIEEGRARRGQYYSSEDDARLEGRVFVSSAVVAGAKKSDVRRARP